jgi:hypothetical protein
MKSEVIREAARHRDVLPDDGRESAADGWLCRTDNLKGKTGCTNAGCTWD